MDFYKIEYSRNPAEMWSSLQTTPPTNRENFKSLAQLVAAFTLSLSVSAAEDVNPQANSAPSAVTMAAVQKGVLTCANQIDKVAKFTGFGPGSAAAILPLTEQPDRSMVAMFMVNKAGREHKAYVSATFAPGQAV